MKALGLLAFRTDLRERFIKQLLGASVKLTSADEVNILFFSRIGEGFFREAIEREYSGKPGAFENQLNAYSGVQSSPIPLDRGH